MADAVAEGGSRPGLGSVSTHAAVRNGGQSLFQLPFRGPIQVGQKRPLGIGRGLWIRSPTRFVSLPEAGEEKAIGVLFESPSGGLRLAVVRTGPEFSLAPKGVELVSVSPRRGQGHRIPEGIGHPSDFIDLGLGELGQRGLTQQRQDRPRQGDDPRMETFGFALTARQALGDEQHVGLLMGCGAGQRGQVPIAGEQKFVELSIAEPGRSDRQSGSVLLGNGGPRIPCVPLRGFGVDPGLFRACVLGTNRFSGDLQSDPPGDFDKPRIEFL